MTRSSLTPFAPWIVLALALGACDDAKQARTQIVVVVRSDLSVPGELDEVRVQARTMREGAPPSELARGMLGGGAPGDDGLALPVSVAFEPSGHELGPIEVTASGHRDGALVVSQVRRLSFARGKSVVLRLDLARSCTGVAAPDCDDDQTCVAGGCEGRFVDVDKLPPYDGPDSLQSSAGGPAGEPPDAGADAAAGDGGVGVGVDRDGGGSGTSGDGGVAGTGSGGGGRGSDDAGGPVPDAGPDAPCEPSAELCNGEDEDCDGHTDEDFDFGSLANCGTCGNTCPESAPFAVSACVSGKCTLVCAPGTADCDEMLSTGCEARLSDTETCGDCDTKCGAGTPFCAQSGDSSMCVGACGGDTPDECGDSCVDTESDIFNCDGCDQPCSDAENGSPVCQAGVCGFECPGAYQDCDGQAGNGCETDTQSDVDNCGGCDAADVCPTRAHATRSCVDAECGFVCAPSYGNCNGSASDGCETNTYKNNDNCGACNVRCTGGKICCGTSCGSLNLLGICL